MKPRIHRNRRMHPPLSLPNIPPITYIWQFPTIPFIFISCSPVIMYWSDHMQWLMFKWWPLKKLQLPMETKFNHQLLQELMESHIATFSQTLVNIDLRKKDIIEEALKLRMVDCFSSEQCIKHFYMDLYINVFHSFWSKYASSSIIMEMNADYSL